jgi:AhpD family alkylhydroperoxidase
MPAFGFVEYEQASPEVKAVYDDIMITRQVDWISNFWKSIAHDPALLRRTWNTLKEIMRPGALDSLTKEMVYLAVSASNQCHYCIASHTAASWKAGMTDSMFGELMSIVGMANETNRLVSGYQVEVDERFQVRDAGWKKYPHPREVVERYFRAMEENRPEELDVLVHRDVTGFDGNEPGSFEMVRNYPAMLHSWVSGIRFELEHCIVSGEWVSFADIVTGVHTGTFLGIPPTGRQIEVRGMGMFRVVKGQIREIRTQWDVGAAMRQLGGDAPLRLPDTIE